MTLYTVLLFYSLSLSRRAGSSFQGRHSGAGICRPMPYSHLTVPSLRTSALQLSGFPFFLQILDQSFVSVFFPASNAGTPGGEATALPSGLHASSCTHGSKGCPARRPLLAGPHSGPEPQVSMLGWNKGVNIYNFLYLL